MTVPCPRPNVIFQQLYQVLLASIIAVICSLTDFTLQIANQHSNVLTVLSYKNGPMMSTVHNQCGVTVIPVHESTFPSAWQQKAQWHCQGIYSEEISWPRCGKT